LYNLTFNNPRILRNGEICPSTICTKESYLERTLKFNVTQFSVYSAEETPPEVRAEVPGGAPGGGGVGCNNDSDCKRDEVCWKGACIKLFDVKIINFTSPAKLGDFFEFTYFVKGMANVNDDVQINFWIEKDGKIVTSGSDVIYIGSFEEKRETTKIFLPTNMKSGIYEFYVEVAYQQYRVRSQRTIEIQVQEGIVRISPIETQKIRTYILISALILFALVLFIIWRIERRRIKKLLTEREIFIKKYKTSILIILLFFMLGVIVYYSGLFALFVKLVPKISLWFKINVLPHLPGILLVILASIGLIILLIIAKKKKWFGSLKRKISIIREKISLTRFLKRRIRAFALSIKKHREERERIRRNKELARRRWKRLKEQRRELERRREKAARSRKEREKERERRNREIAEKIAERRRERAKELEKEREEAKEKRMQRLKEQARELERKKAELAKRRQERAKERERELARKKEERARKRQERERELIRKKEERARKRQERLEERERKRKEFLKQLARRKEESIKKAKEKLKKGYHGLLNDEELELLKEIQTPEELKDFKKRRHLLNPKELSLLREIRNKKREKKIYK